MKVKHVLAVRASRPTSRGVTSVTAHNLEPNCQPCFIAVTGTHPGACARGAVTRGAQGFGGRPEGTSACGPSRIFAAAAILPWWVPVLLEQVAELVQGRAEAQAQSQSDTPDATVHATPVAAAPGVGRSITFARRLSPSRTMAPCRVHVRSLACGRQPGHPGPQPLRQRPAGDRLSAVAPHAAISAVLVEFWRANLAAAARH